MVILAKYKFPHYWPFVRGVHWSLVDSPHKRPVMKNLGKVVTSQLNVNVHHSDSIPMQLIDKPSILKY